MIGRCDICERTGRRLVYVEDPNTGQDGFICADLPDDCEEPSHPEGTP